MNPLDAAKNFFLVKKDISLVEMSAFAIYDSNFSKKYLSFCNFGISYGRKYTLHWLLDKIYPKAGVLWQVSGQAIFLQHYISGGTPQSGV